MLHLKFHENHFLFWMEEGTSDTHIEYIFSAKLCQVDMGSFDILTHIKVYMQPFVFSQLIKNANTHQLYHLHSQ